MMTTLFFILVMLTACYAKPEDLSGKMFTFPQESKTSFTRLTTSSASFTSVSVCLRFLTDLSRNHALFSLSTPSSPNSFLIFKTGAEGQISQWVLNQDANSEGFDYKRNLWNTICSTWDSHTGLGQLWLNGISGSRKFIRSGNISGTPIVILGQEQDSHGGGFDASQSFVGMMTDVHMWNYVLSPCEIQRYTSELNFTPGNVINWRSLEYQTTGRVLVEIKQLMCDA